MYLISDLFLLRRMSVSIFTWIHHEVVPSAKFLESCGLSIL